MKSISYKVTIKKVGGIVRSVPYEEEVMVQCPATKQDILDLIESEGEKFVCKAVFDSLKLIANGKVRLKLTQAGSPKANKADAQRWLFATQMHPMTDIGTQAMIAAANGKLDDILETTYEKHGEAIREYLRSIGDVSSSDGSSDSDE